MINATIRQIFDARESLLKLLDIKLPIRVSYQLMKLTKKLNTEIDTFHTLREKFIKKYEIPDNIRNFNELPETIATPLLAEMDTLLDETLSIECYPVDFSNVNVELSAKEIATLEPFCIFETTILN